MDCENGERGFDCVDHKSSQAQMDSKSTGFLPRLKWHAEFADFIRIEVKSASLLQLAVSLGCVKVRKVV